MVCRFKNVLVMVTRKIKKKQDGNKSERLTNVDKTYKEKEEAQTWTYMQDNIDRSTNGPQITE